MGAALMIAAALFKQFLPGDIVRSKTMGLGVVPGKELAAMLDVKYGPLQHTEVRFICLRDGEVYTHRDNYVTQLYGRLHVKEF